MQNPIRLIACFLFCIAGCSCLYSQSASVSQFMKALDKVENDSVAIQSLDSLAKTGLTVEQQLKINFRIVVRAYLSQQFTKAITVANQCISLANKNKLDSLEAAFNEQLGNAYYYMENRQKAIVEYKKGIEMAEKHDYWEIAAACYNNMSAAHIDISDTKNGEIYLLKSIDLMTANGKGNDPNTNRSRRILATLYTKTNRPKKAEAIYLDLIAKSRKNNDTIILSYSLLYYSELLRQRHDSLKAVALSTEALAYIRKRTEFQDLLTGITYHAQNLASAGRAKEAYELMKESDGILKKTFAEDLNKQVSEVEVKYKTARIRQEKEQAEENAKTQRWIYLLSFAGILILLTAIAWTVYQRRNAAQRSEAHKQRIEALIEGEEKERMRIARDLHDGIVQDLAAIKMKLNAGDKTGAPVSGIVSDLDRATKEVRDIAYQMMPVALREYGLEAALQQLLEKALPPHNILFEFEMVNISERLPEKIEVCLYRITQELVNNVIKHSKASFISLVVSSYQDAVTLVLEDNGTGFKEEEIKKGIGMNSLSSRLEMVNGNLKFESASGSGTMAIIKIPLTT